MPTVLSTENGWQQVSQNPQVLRLQMAELAPDQVRSTVARSGFNTVGSISPASFQCRIGASPSAGRERAWLVMAMIRMSGRAR